MKRKITSIILIITMLLTSISLSLAANTNLATGTPLDAISIDYPLSKKQLDGLGFGKSLGKIAGKGNTFDGMQINHEGSSITLVMLPNFTNNMQIDAIVVNATNDYKIYYYPRSLRAGDAVTVNTEGLGNNKNKLSQIGSIEFYHINADALDTISYPPVNNPDDVYSLDSEGLLFDGTTSEDGEDWYALKVKASTLYEVMVYPNNIYAEVTVFDREMLPVIPDASGVFLTKGEVYYMCIEFPVNEYPQEYTCIITPRINKISDYWIYYGDLFTESPDNWIAITPDADGDYYYCFETEDIEVSAVVWDEGFSIPMGAEGSLYMQFGKVYYIEVKTDVDDFYFMPYIITIQLFNDEDEEEEEDEEEDDDDDDIGPEFEYDLPNEEYFSPDDLIPEGAYADDIITSMSFAFDMDSDDFSGDEPFEDNIKPEPDYDAECDHSDCDGHPLIVPSASGQYWSGRKIDWADGYGTYYPKSSSHTCTQYHPSNYNGTKFSRSGYRQIGWRGNSTGRQIMFSSTGSWDFTTDSRWTAIWEPSTATLTYNANKATSGNPPNTYTYTFNSSVTVSGNNTLARTGFTFYGWNTRADGTGTYYLTGSRITLNANITLYAIWQGTITYLSDGSDSGVAPAPQTFIADSRFTLSSMGGLSKNGYDPAGWIVVSSAPVKYTKLSSTVSLSGSTVLRPYFKPQMGTITYVSYDHDDGTEPKQQQFIVNNLISLRGPGSLKKTGYKFAGWADSDGTVYTKKVRFPGDITLSVVWKEDIKTLKYSSRGAKDGDPPLSQEFLKGLPLPRPIQGNIGNLSKPGWDFVNWKKGSIIYNIGESPVFIKNTTLYPNWARKNYTIRYDPNEADYGTVPSPQTYDYSKSFRLQPNGGGLRRDNFVFNGWNTKQDGTGKRYKAGGKASLKGEIILYAQWKPITYSIKYNRNGATSGSPPKTQKVKYPFAEEISEGGTLGNVGKVFTGWNTDINGSGMTYLPGVKAKVAENTTLYATWVTGISYVTYNGAGADRGVPPAHSYSPNVVFSLSRTDKLVRTCHTFMGWNTHRQADMGIHYEDEQKVMFTGGLMPLYAEWEALDYTLTYDGNDGHGTIPDPVTASAETLITLSMGIGMERGGYAFAEWNTRSDGTGYSYNTSISLTEDTTLYAIWKPSDGLLVPASLGQYALYLYRYGISANQVFGNGLPGLVGAGISSDHYENNKNVTFSDLSPQGHIMHQYKNGAEQISMGFAPFSSNACGWMAVYNALISMNNSTISPAEIVRWLETNDALILDGAFGVNPSKYRDLFLLYGYYAYTTNIQNNLDAQVKAGGTAILCYMSKEGLSKGAHYINVTWNGGVFIAYNEDQGKPHHISSIDAFIENKTGGLIAMTVIM